MVRAGGHVEWRFRDRRMPRRDILPRAAFAVNENAAGHNAVPFFASPMRKFDFAGSRDF
jgi:hypothetical protein